MTPPPALGPIGPTFGGQAGGGVKTGVILVGHGAFPKDCPKGLVQELKSLEMKRSVAGGEISERERALDRRVRRWPRNAQNDPYRAGLETLAKHLETLLDGASVSVAFNEFCVPSLEEAAESLVASGANRVVVVPSMFIPGGGHCEKDIPDVLERLRSRYPRTEILYAWPFDLEVLSRMVAEQVRRFNG